MGAFGFELNPFSPDNRFVLRVVEGDGTATRIRIPEDQLGPIYIGLSSPAGIRSVVITGDRSLPGSIPNFSLDDVSRTHISP